jgi:hypothetical protein
MFLIKYIMETVKFQHVGFFVCVIMCDEIRLPH